MVLPDDHKKLIQCAPCLGFIVIDIDGNLAPGHRTLSQEWYGTISHKRESLVGDFGEFRAAIIEISVHRLTVHCLISDWLNVV